MLCVSGYRFFVALSIVVFQLISFRNNFLVCLTLVDCLVWCYFNDYTKRWPVEADPRLSIYLYKAFWHVVTPFFMSGASIIPWSAGFLQYEKRKEQKEIELMGS